MADLVESIKKAALDAVANSDPSAVLFGKVTGVAPLKIQINQKLILEEACLVLTRNVTEYDLDITPDEWTTESADSHRHGITGKKSIKVHNALEEGDEVILIRQAGGQQYIVLDRVG